MRGKGISFIEKIAERLGLIENLYSTQPKRLDRLTKEGELVSFPPPDKWDNWQEYEATSGQKREVKNYVIVPTICFNCEAGCGLLTYIDKETLKIRKIEGNPYHPGSRGRNCAKGPATLNQIEDVERILYPLRRAGKRGEGKWERVSWDEALNDIAARIRKALKEGRRNEVVYHVGRPGHEGFIERILQAWGVDGHNSHTNVCSSSARLGYAIWQGYDRPSPDHANAQFILLVSSHLESGHYFNPHAQRIIEGMMNGAKLAVMDPRLSNTASMADYWMPTHPGSEAAVLLSMAKVILDEGLYNKDFLFNWVNWRKSLKELNPQAELTFDNFISELRRFYAEYTPEFAEKESGVSADMIREVARKIGEAGTRFSSHNWRSASSGNLGGWMVSRCLHFLNVLTGSVGTFGGTLPSGWNKFKPKGFSTPPPQDTWNELHFPLEYPFSHYEMSFLLPHFLKEGRGRLEVYFTRVFNPVWTYPDGFTWIEALTDEDKIGLHVALTPSWNETAYFADYVLPMGLSPERHDLVSYETHSGLWIGFRQPVLREALRKMGKEVKFTYEANPGEVWEEDEFWFELSWRIDEDGSLGIRQYFISPYREGEKITIDEYYRYIFENEVKGLPEKAAQEGLTPYDYMKKYAAFELEKHCYEMHMKPLSEKELEGAEVKEETGEVVKNGQVIGIVVDGIARTGFPTPSRRQELFSQTLKDWGWGEYAFPTYIKSHIHPEKLDKSKDEVVLVATFRLPTQIHTRSGNSKWLAEISHYNPVWINTEDAKRWGLKTGDLIRVNTEIGYFVNRVWVTEGIKPGVIACSHHFGRWRRQQDRGNRWLTNLVKIDKVGDGKWKMSLEDGVSPYESDDPDTSLIFWSEGGVHQNLTFPVHPDPLSGMHCWHQKVTVEKAHEGDQYGDVFVDTEKAFAVYKEWLQMTRPAPGPNGLRRPLWLGRPLKPKEETFYVKQNKQDRK